MIRLPISNLNSVGEIRELRFQRLQRRTSVLALFNKHIPIERRYKL